jgi:diaminopimelate decarboxylase
MSSLSAGLVQKILGSSSGVHFLYLEKILNQDIQSLKQSLTASGFQKLFYSVKSNPNPFLVQAIAKQADGFDVSTEAEMRMLSKTGIDGDRMTFSGPAKTTRALELALNLRVGCLHLDSFDEFTALQSLERGRPSQVPKTIRLANAEAASHKLGCSNQEIAMIMEKASAQEFQGFHFYLGREKFSAALFQASVDRALQIYQQHRKHFTDRPQIFLGLGLPAQDMVRAHQLLPVEPVKSPFILNVECGRSIVQGCGVYASSVLSRKSSEASDVVILDGGLQHMATHLGSPRFAVEGVEVQFFRGSAFLSSQGQTRGTLHGSLSLWHDRLIENIAIPEDLSRSDWVLMSKTGAYGWTAASNQFIGPSPFQEWWISEAEEVFNITPNQIRSYHQGGLHGC